MAQPRWGHTCRHTTSAPSACANASGLGMFSPARLPSATSFTFFKSACNRHAGTAGERCQSGAWARPFGAIQGRAAAQAGRGWSPSPCSPTLLHTFTAFAPRPPTLSPATFHDRMRQAGTSSASGAGRRLLSQRGPAGALGLAGARFALGLAAVAVAGLPAGSPSAAAAAGSAAAGASACASALRLRGGLFQGDSR